MRLALPAARSHMTTWFLSWRLISSFRCLEFFRPQAKPYPGHEMALLGSGCRQVRRKLQGEKMSTPFLSEIKIVSFNFAPKGWALCNGQLMPINQNQALFSLLGTTYGGDGRVNFALPNLQARIPNHMGGNFTLGQRGGEPAHTLSVNELSAHNHVPVGNKTNPATASGATGNLWGLI